MKIVLINGSPKPKAEDSASHILLNDLRTFLLNQDIDEIHLNKPLIKEEDLNKLKKTDVIVFSFPLYFDSIPSQLLSCIYELEKLLYSLPIMVFSISNNGFYEGIQNRYALDVIKNWTIRTNLVWGQGVGVGGGGMISEQDIPIGKGPKKDLGKALKIMSENILNKKSSENIFVNLKFPRFLYKMIGNFQWKIKARKNGLRVRNMYKM